MMRIITDELQGAWMVCPERTFKEFYHVSSSTSSHVTTHTVPFMLVVPKGKSKRGRGGWRAGK